jgi:hypothetical protein
MKVLDKYSANGLLRGIGLEIGKRDRIVFLDESKKVVQPSIWAQQEIELKQMPLQIFSANLSMYHADVLGQKASHILEGVNWT